MTVPNRIRPVPPRNADECGSSSVLRRYPPGGESRLWCRANSAASSLLRRMPRRRHNQSIHCVVPSSRSLPDPQICRPNTLGQGSPAVTGRGGLSWIRTSDFQGLNLVLYPLSYQINRCFPKPCTERAEPKSSDDPRAVGSASTYPKSMCPARRECANARHLHPPSPANRGRIDGSSQFLQCLVLSAHCVGHTPQCAQPLRSRNNTYCCDAKIDVCLHASTARADSANKKSPGSGDRSRGFGINAPNASTWRAGFRAIHSRFAIAGLAECKAVEHATAWQGVGYELRHRRPIQSLSSDVMWRQRTDLRSVLCFHA